MNITDKLLGDRQEIVRLEESTWELPKTREYVDGLLALAQSWDLAPDEWAYLKLKGHIADAIALETGVDCLADLTMLRLWSLV